MNDLSDIPVQRPGRPDVARVMSLMLDRFGGELLISRHRVGDEIRTTVTVGQRNLSHAVLKEQVDRSKGDRLARELEEMLCRFSNQLG